MNKLNYMEKMCNLVFILIDFLTLSKGFKHIECAKALNLECFYYFHCEEKVIPVEKELLRLDQLLCKNAVME